MSRCRRSFVLMLVLTAVGAAANSPRLRAEDVLRSLRPQHPRLYLDDAGFVALKRRVEKTEPYRTWHSLLQREAEGILDTAPVAPELTGKRLLAQSRLALLRISTLAGLYRLDGDVRKAERAKKEMLAAAAFPDWNPNHFLDTAEMTHALAIGYDWLYDELSAEDRGTIRKAIVEKGLQPGLKVYESQKGWTVRVNNWNQVCNGGMAIGALAIADEEPELARLIIDYSRQSIVRAMKSFAPDGGWNEGPMYWDYATRYNVSYLATVESALGTDFGLLAMPGFSQTGEFRIHTIGPSGLMFNFGDSRDYYFPTPHMLWMARKFHRPEYEEHERKMVGDKPRIFHLVYSSDTPVEKAPALPPCAWFRDCDVTFLRSDWQSSAVYVGFKAGDNRASHSHLDLGSFVLDSQGVRWAVDLGADDYDLPRYFGSSRWSYFRLRTESHNTLTVDGENQSSSAKAPIIAFRASADRSFAVADLSAAYSDKLAEQHRGIELLKRRNVLVQDDFEAKLPVKVTWNMYTPADIKLHGGRAVLTLGNARLFARILSPTDATFEIAPADAPSPQAQQPGISSLRFQVSVGKGPQRLAVVLTPDDHPDENFSLESLDQWAVANQAK